MINVIAILCAIFWHADRGHVFSQWQTFHGLHLIIVVVSLFQNAEQANQAKIAIISFLFCHTIICARRAFLSNLFQVLNSLPFHNYESFLIKWILPLDSSRFPVTISTRIAIINICSSDITFFHVCKKFKYYISFLTSIFNVFIISFIKLWLFFDLCFQVW